MLIFATAAALRLTTEWGLSYSELIPYATPGFIAFGVCAIPAGWLADKWSREGMMSIFFIGIGLSAIITGLANSPFQILISLLLIGIFAAIYHPVGLAMVVQGQKKMGMPLAINGVFGNMGVASAALLSGFLIDTTGWRSAFILSGIASVLLGVGYIVYLRKVPNNSKEVAQSTTVKTNADELNLPIGWYTFIVFSVAAFAQLVVGYLVDHYPIRIVFATVALLQCAFFALMVPLDGVAGLVVAIAFMLAVFGQIPINDVLIGRLVKSEWRSRAYGVRYIVWLPGFMVTGALADCLFCLPLRHRLRLLLH